MSRIFLAPGVTAPAPDQRFLSHLFLDLRRGLVDGFGIQVCVFIMPLHTCQSVIVHGGFRQLLREVCLNHAHAHAHQAFYPFLHIGRAFRVGEVQCGHHGASRISALSQLEEAYVPVSVLYQVTPLLHKFKLRGILFAPSPSALQGHIGEHPQREMEALVPEFANHILRLRKSLLVKCQDLCTALGRHHVKPAVDMYHVRRHAEFFHPADDFLHLRPVHIAHAGHPESEGPSGNHGRSACIRGILPEKPFVIPVAEHVIIQVRVLRFHGVCHAGRGSHIKMGSGVCVHQNEIARRAHKAGHSLVGNIGIGGLGVPLPYRDALSPFVEIREFFSESIERLVTVHIHGFKGIRNLSVRSHGESKRNGFVFLAHVEILNLFLRKHLAVQQNRHFPGTFPETEKHSVRGRGDVLRFLLHLHFFVRGKVENLVRTHRLPALRKHLQPKYRLPGEGHLYQGASLMISVRRQ